MKKHLKVLIFVLTAAIATGAMALAACEEEIIVEDSGSYIDVLEI